MTLQEEVGENTVFVLVTSGKKGARRQQESYCLRRKGATHGPEELHSLVEIFFLVVLLSYYNGYLLS